jgi:cytochrome c
MRAVGKNRAMACRHLDRRLFFICMAALGTISAAVATGVQGNAERGRRLLAQYQCGSCHTIPGVASAAGTHASTLQGFGLRSYIAGRVVNRPELLARWIAQPHSLVPGTPMPSMGVSAADARDMAAYLLELR